MNACPQRVGAQAQLLAILGFALLAASASAATFPLTWRWSNPLPHGNNIIDVAQANQFWIQVAERGQLYTSGDLVEWTPRESRTTRDLRAVTFFKDQIVITGEAGTVLSGESTLHLALIDLGTEDWLEGVAASPDLAVAAGDNGAIYTSADGANWQRQSPPFDVWLRSVAYGTPNGAGLFVAVGESGFVAASGDGIGWEAQKAITDADLNRVAWFGDKFWILGDSGAAFASDSGLTWSAVQTGATNSLNAFAGLGATRLVAGDLEVRLGQEGGPWSDELTANKSLRPPAWTYLSATADTNSILLCGRTGMIQEAVVSANGAAAWFAFDDSPRNWLWDIKRFPNVYLAVGDLATIMSSVDGVEWDVELPPDSSTNAIFLGVGGKTNLAVAVGNQGTMITSKETFDELVSTNVDGTLLTNRSSTLGLDWEAVSPRPTTNDLQGVSVFGDLFVVSGALGTILTSPDGVIWTRRTTPVTSFLSSLESFPGGVVAVGRSGTILTSPDAATWTARSSQTTSWIYRVRFLNGRLIAVGQDGTILTSPDGIEWTRQNSGTTRWLNDVHWLADTYFAVGNQGTVLTSPDGAIWTDRGTTTGKSLFAAASAAGMLVVAGVEGVILRSQVTPLETPVNFVTFSRTSEESAFLFSGQPGQKFRLDRSVSLPDWTPGPLLEIDNTGTLLHVGGDSNSAHQFFRTSLTP